MQFTIFTALTLSSVALAAQLGYDNTYDNADGSLTTVACSDGSNGLINRGPGYSTFSSLPVYPNIGSSSSIEGWNSVNCGSCYRLTYVETGNSILFLAIDHAGNGFVSSQEAMDTLTNGHAVEYGIVDVDVEQVDASQCGI